MRTKRRKSKWLGKFQSLRSGIQESLRLISTVVVNASIISNIVDTLRMSMLSNLTRSEMQSFQCSPMQLFRAITIDQVCLVSLKST
jgi:hypothetical protein